MASKAQLELVAEASAQPEKVKQSDLDVIVSLARGAYKKAQEIATAEDKLRKLKEDYNTLMAVTLPERMEACGLKNFELGNGFQISIKDFISASIPTEKQIEDADGLDKEMLLSRRKACFEWLKKHKADSLIKSKLSAEFGKGENKKARQFLKLIEAAGFPARCNEEVNYNTLQSFMKECLGKGIDVPSEPFNLFIGKKAELKEGKK